MEDVLEVDELDTLADLAHEDGASSFRQDEIVVDHPLKEFASFDAFVAILEKCKINLKKKQISQRVSCWRHSNP